MNKNKPTRSPGVFRQGDILIIGIEKIPGKTKRLAKADRHIVAEGEATGHHHAIPDVEGLTVYARKQNNHDESMQFWVQVETAPARMEHPEHGTIEIPLGNYEIRRQREYDPVEARYVYD